MSTMKVVEASVAAARRSVEAAKVTASAAGAMGPMKSVVEADARVSASAAVRSSEDVERPGSLSPLELTEAGVALIAQLFGTHRPQLTQTAHDEITHVRSSLFGVFVCWRRAF